MASTLVRAHVNPRPPQDHPASPRRALVVGRFQPPHLGHIHLLREAAAQADETIVVVGSADKSHTRDNPFTAGERIAMIAAAAHEAGLALAHIIPIDDLGRYHLWAAHVAAHVPAFDVVVTGSAMTAHLFQAAGHPVHVVAHIQRETLQATSVRVRLMRGEDVSDVVPPAVRNILKSAWVRERLTALGD